MDQKDAVSAGKNKIIFVAGAKPSYPRNSNALNMLREEFDVKEITSNAGNYAIRFLAVGLRFLFARKKVSAIYVGWMGHPLVILSKLISRKPVVFDVFISLYDSICLERKAVSPNSLFGKLIFWFDKISCRLADEVIVDTATHREFFIKTFGLKPERVKVFYICADEQLFKPLPAEKTGKFILEFHGGYIPLQGVEYIIRAAKILERHEDIEFRLLGSGRDMPAMKSLTEKLNLHNVKFFDKFVPITEVPPFINRGDVALGIFGIVDKTWRVIPNKVYEGVACRKATISGDTVAIKELFEDGRDILLVKTGDPRDLADKITLLKNNIGLRQKIADGGYETFKRVCDYGTRKKILTQFVNEIIK